MALAACGSSASSSGAPTASSSRLASPRPAPARHCGPAGATTLAASSQARVYAWRGGVFGCSFAHRRSFRLGSTERSLREDAVSPVALAGSDAAYGRSNFGIDTVMSAVAVTRLTDGKQLADFAATSIGRPEGVQSVASVVVKRDGAVAWIGTDHSLVARGRDVVEVHAVDAAALPMPSVPPSPTAGRLLDSGPQVAPGSLRLHGSTLTWKHGAAVRHATLR